jgi:hypothetical protein
MQNDDENDPPFFVPDQNHIHLRQIFGPPFNSHAKHVPITGLFGPTLAEFNQTTSTTIALKD